MWAYNIKDIDSIKNAMDKVNGHGRLGDSGNV